MAVSLLQLVLFLLSLLVNSVMVVQGTSWCVARSDASNQALQTALDYACGSGADCNPIQSDGLCFLPNTMLAHASYAFNSYYQRRGMAPGSCGFAGTGTVAKTDPSYGSCMYPSSQRCSLDFTASKVRWNPTQKTKVVEGTAGGIVTPTPPTTPTPSTTVTNNPNVPTTTTTTPINGDGSTGLNNPGLTPPISTTDDSKASLDCIVATSSISIVLLFVLSFILHPIWTF